MHKINLTVDPGVCGFTCRIEGWLKQKRVAGFKILGSECKMINKLSASIDELALNDLFRPLTRNPVFVSAERACCHAACPVPVAIVKTMEVVLGMAVAKNVALQFPDGRKAPDHEPNE